MIVHRVISGAAHANPLYPPTKIPMYKTKQGGFSGGVKGAHGFRAETMGPCGVVTRTSRATVLVGC
jgi:hypothetical protein